MRRLIACLVLWVWALPAFGGVSGRVTSIGFQAYVRAEQWIPITVSIDSDEPAAHTFDLRVVQSDLDGDDVMYTRAGVTINPGQQTFRTYFRPETVNGGLPASGQADSAEFSKRLRVFLYDPATKNSIRLAVAGATPKALEPGVGTIGQKLVLIVGRPPSFNEFAGSNVYGLAEQCVFVPVDPRRLPDSALAYGAVDAVVWTNADASKLDPQQRKALRDYIYGGGTLAVVQNADAALTAAFAEFLPVTTEPVVEWTSSEPLKSIVTPRNTARPRDVNGRAVDPWARTLPPFRMTAATPVDATVVVDTWIDWPDKRRTPFIARRLFGSGCVAWLAQDVTDPTFAALNFGWPRLWERVFDWRDNDLYLSSTAVTGDDIEKQKHRFDPQMSRDLGASFISGMDVKGRTVALISLSFVFFIGYWALAGPVSYLVLAARKRTQLSWLTFGVIAVLATMMTLAISALVLRGDSKVSHVSLVRLRGAEPARVLSNVGVYLPKDKRVDISVPQTAGGPPASITPFAVDPELNKREATPRDSSYEVPIVSGDTESGNVAISVPFRSTLKKLQTDWTGPLQSGIGGKPVLLDSVTEPIDGRLTNDTGRDLAGVVFIFRDGRDPFDHVLAIPEWKKGDSVDLKAVWNSAERKLSQLSGNRSGLNLFPGKPVRGRWADAAVWLLDDLRPGAMGTDAKFDDSPDAGGQYTRSYPLVSLFARCPPMTNATDETKRADVIRRGVRQWDASPAVAAGALVVIAKSGGPLPVPLTVDGETPEGDGRLFYQAVVPLDRTAANTPEIPEN